MYERDLRVSVITVCLNSEKTIERTIQSVVSQTYPNIEYIVIDGKSTDRTLEIIDKYRHKIDRLVSEKDEGIYDAMNKGLRLTTGGLIGFISSNDWYEPDAIEATVSAFLNDGYADVIYGNTHIYDDKGNFLRIRYPSAPKELHTWMAIPHTPVFIRGDIYRKHGFNTKYRWGADHELLLKIYSRGYVFRHIDRSIANFALGGYSCTHPCRRAFENAMISLRYANRPSVIVRIVLRFFRVWSAHFGVTRPAVLTSSRIVRVLRKRRLRA
jgi:glycosyltransferase involved in cell wall biosynthesis